MEELRNAPKADGQTRIYTHGEKEVEAEKKLMENGIPVNDNTMVEVYEMCQYLDMDFSKYFGDYIPEASEGFKSPETFK
jgi:LDH2 family malate/lactate/ureidoglycolate dehydrogenase